MGDITVDYHVQTFAVDTKGRSTISDIYDQKKGALEFYAKIIVRR
jgi:hypothetical protein